MFEAQMLVTKSALYSILGPWFPRQGDNIRVTLELVAAKATGSKITVYVLTKPTESTGDGTLVGGSIFRTGADAGSRVTGEWAGTVSELLRYKYTVEGTNGNTADEW